MELIFSLPIASSVVLSACAPDNGAMDSVPLTVGVTPDQQVVQAGLTTTRASAGAFGDFSSSEVERSFPRALLQLTHPLAQKMAARKRGGIIFMSSLVSFQGALFIAYHAANKAYCPIFREHPKAPTFVIPANEGRPAIH